MKLSIAQRLRTATAQLLKSAAVRGIPLGQSVARFYAFVRANLPAVQPHRIRELLTVTRLQQTLLMRCSFGDQPLLAAQPGLLC